MAVNYHKELERTSNEECGYLCFYRGGQYAVFATTSFGAQAKLAKHLKLNPKKRLLIDVNLVEGPIKNQGDSKGETIVHNPGSL